MGHGQCGFHGLRGPKGRWMASWGFRVAIQNPSYALGARQQHVDGVGREQGEERSRAWGPGGSKAGHFLHVPSVPVRLAACHER